VGDEERVLGGRLKNFALWEECMDESDLEERFQLSKEASVSIQRDLDEDMVVDSQIPASYYDLALQYRDMGMAKCRLGEDSSHYFEKASDSFLKAAVEAERLEEKDERSDLQEVPLRLADSTHMAMLSRNSEKESNVAEKCLDMSENYLGSFSVSNWHFYCKCLASSIQEDIQSVEKFEEKLENSEKTLKREENFPKLVNAIIPGDKKAAKEAVKTQLKSHKSDLTDSGGYADDKLISVEATAWILLARKNGIEIDIDDILMPDFI
jgi:hypothetical protein